MVTPEIRKRSQLPARRATRDAPALLGSWFAEAGLLDRRPGSDRSDLRAALELREAIYALLRTRPTGHPRPVWR